MTTHNAGRFGASRSASINRGISVTRRIPLTRTRAVFTLIALAALTGCEHSQITGPPKPPPNATPLFARFEGGCPASTYPDVGQGTTNTRAFVVVNAGGPITVTAKDADTGIEFILGSNASMLACTIGIYNGWAEYTFHGADGSTLLIHAGPLPGPGGATVPFEKPFVVNAGVVPPDLYGRLRTAVSNRGPSSSKFKLRTRSAAMGVRG
jgi:hypothetical protein